MDHTTTLTRLERTKDAREKQQKGNKRFWLILGIIVALLVTSIGGYGISIWQNYQKNIKEMNKNDLPDAKQVADVNKTPFTVLLIGLGTNGFDGENTLADSINILTVNPEKRIAEIVALPRDSYVPFGEACEWGAGYYDKVTHTTSVDAGGAACLQSTLEDLFDIEINYYVSINFNGFVKIVDALGGITMNVPDLRSGFEAWQGDIDEGTYLDPSLKTGDQWCEHNSNRDPYQICFKQFGEQVVNGEQALALARSRHYDSDLGRSLRQTELIKAIAKKSMSMSGLFSINGLLDAAGATIETNIPADQFPRFIPLAANLFGPDNETPMQIRTTQLAGRGSTFVGDRISSMEVYYSLVPISSIEDIRFKLATALDSNPEATLAVEGFFFTIGESDTTANASGDVIYDNMDVTDPETVRQFQ